MIQIIFIITFSLFLSADSVSEFVVRAQDTKIEFSVKAGLFNHAGKVNNVLGAFLVDSNTKQLLNAEFIVPIDEVETGDKNRDCHMRESLGLDYASSEFPEKHVCLADDTLPETGPNAVVYPNIILKIISIREANTNLPILLNQALRADVIAEAQWTIHGQSKLVELKAVLIKTEANDNVIQLQGRTTLKLSDFGVQVKPFLGVGAEDKIPVKVNAILEAR